MQNAKWWCGIVCIAAMVLASCGASGPPRTIAHSTLYVLDQVNRTLTAMSIDDHTGELTQVGAPVATGDVPGAIATSLIGKFLYVSSASAPVVTPYAIDGRSAPQPLTNLAASTPNGPAAMVRLGGFLFVGCSGAVAAFAVNDATGALTPAPGSPFTFLGSTQQMVADRTGKFLYILRTSGPGLGQGAIAAFAINSQTGALTPVPGSPFVIPGPNGGMVADPAGDFLYVSATTSLGGPPNDNILTLAIGGDGALSQGTTTASDPFPGLMLMNLNAPILYLEHAGATVELNSYAVVVGTLAKIGTPVALPTQAAAMAFDARSGTLYVGLHALKGVAAFQADSSGRLTPVAGSPLQGKDTAALVVVAPAAI